LYYSIFTLKSAIIPVMNINTDLFLSLLDKLGWMGNWLFLFIAAIECIPFIGAVIPGGTLIFVAGFLAAHGYFNVYDVLIFSTLGALLGDYSGYALGRWGGNWLRRNKIISAELITKGEEFFHKYGVPSIFWGRFIGAARAIVPFIAGSTRLKPKIFFFWNLIGAIGWAITHVLLGYFSGNIVAIVIHKWSHRLSIIVIIGLLVLFFYWLIKKHHQNIWRYYVRTSEILTNKLFVYSWFQKLTGQYPIAGELFQNQVNPLKVFSTFLASLILIILYSLVLILDLI